MKIIRKIRPIEVKRAFVIAQKIRFSQKEKYMPKITKADFLKKLKQAKTATTKLKEEQLDAFISANCGGGKKAIEYNNKEWRRKRANALSGMEWYKKRTRAYNDAEWCIVEMSVNELGAWRRSGGLPSAWTCCSLDKTARYVKKGLEIDSKQIRRRSKNAIPGIIEFADIISREKYLFPIVFKGGTGTRGRKWCKTKTKGDIDDGCMRSIALAVAGQKILRVYFGRPKK